MASFFSFLTTKKFPSKKTVHALLHGPVTSFSVLVYSIFFVLCAAFFVLLITINSHFLTTVPARGGTLTEGVIGAPHFINPLLSTTTTDQRLTALVYGSLMTIDDTGTLHSSLAQNYTVSPDGLTYTLSLIPNSKFDDGKPLTSDDVAFTVAKLQDSAISTQSVYWQNITVATPDANTVVFTLPAADTSFLSHLTFGILPQHVWNNITDSNFATAPQNLRPVGAGPMKMTSVQYTNSIADTVTLSRNKYWHAEILLQNLRIQSFANQSQLLDALNGGRIDFSYSLTPSSIVPSNVLSSVLTVSAVPTAYTVSIYRSSGDTILSNSVTVAQINQLIDKNAIIATVQDGYGTPSGISSGASSSPHTTTQTNSAIKGFSIAVMNDPVLLLAAHTFAQQLAQVGIPVSINAFDPGTFQQNINTGSFPVIMMRNDNTTVIPSAYQSVIPLYTESVPYIFNTRTHTIPPATFQSPAIEYEHIQDWYTYTDKLWKWFIQKK